MSHHCSKLLSWFRGSWASSHSLLESWLTLLYAGNHNCWQLWVHWCGYVHTVFLPDSSSMLNSKPWCVCVCVCACALTYKSKQHKHVSFVAEPSVVTYSLHCEFVNLIHCTEKHLWRSLRTAPIPSSGLFQHSGCVVLVEALLFSIYMNECFVCMYIYVLSANGGQKRVPIPWN